MGYLLGFKEKGENYVIKWRIGTNQKLENAGHGQPPSQGSSRAGWPSGFSQLHIPDWECFVGRNFRGTFGAQNLERGLLKLLPGVCDHLKVIEESCQAKRKISTGTSVVIVETIHCKIAGTDTWWGIQRIRALQNSWRPLVNTLTSQTRNLES